MMRMARATTRPKIIALPVKLAWLPEELLPDLLRQLADEEPVGIERLAEFLGIHRDTVTMLIKSQGLPAKKVGGKWEAYLTLVKLWRAYIQLKG
jgi:excisionase family DNA binding protein